MKPGRGRGVNAAGVRNPCGGEAYRNVVENRPRQHGGVEGREGATAEAALTLCPYCGGAQGSETRCASCGGMFEPLSRQASQNQMGPWSVRDERHPFRPGCSYETLRRMASRGMIVAESVIRGPSTRQFWTLARNTPGVAHLVGECHACHAPASADDFLCAKCGAAFSAPEDRQALGLGPVRLLPGQAAPDVVARSSLESERGAGVQAGGVREAPVAASVARPAQLPRPEEPEAPASRVDATNALTAANRRLRRRMEKMRLVVLGLVMVNVALLLILAVMASPRVGFAPAAGNGAAEGVVEEAARD